MNLEKKKGGGGCCCSSAATVDNVKWVEERAGVTRPNFLKLLVTVQLLDTSQTSRYRIVLDELGYRKLPARWIPKQLSDDHKKQRLGVRRNLLKGNIRIARVVAGVAEKLSLTTTTE